MFAKWGQQSKLYLDMLYPYKVIRLCCRKLTVFIGRNWQLGWGCKQKVLSLRIIPTLRLSSAVIGILKHPEHSKIQKYRHHCYVFFLLVFLGSSSLCLKTNKFTCIWFAIYVVYGMCSIWPSVSINRSNVTYNLYCSKWSYNVIHVHKGLSHIKVNIQIRVSNM